MPSRRTSTNNKREQVEFIEPIAEWLGQQLVCRYAVDRNPGPSNAESFGYVLCLPSKVRLPYSTERVEQRIRRRTSKRNISIMIQHRPKSARPMPTPLADTPWIPVPGPLPPTALKRPQDGPQNRRRRQAVSHPHERLATARRVLVLLLSTDELPVLVPPLVGADADEAASRTPDEGAALCVGLGTRPGHRQRRVGTSGQPCAGWLR